MSSFKGSQGRSGFRHSKIKWNIFKELLLNNAEGSQRVCRDGSGVFLGEPDYLLHFWRLNVVQGCKTNRGGIWLRLRPWWQECGSLGLRYSLQQRRSWGAGWIPALYVNCSFTVPSQDFNPPPPTSPIPEPRQQGQEALGHRPAPLASGSCHSETHNLNPQIPDLFFTPFPRQSHAIHVSVRVRQRPEWMEMHVC